MKIRYLVEGESEPREVEEPNFDFEEYKDLMMGKITDEHGNALNDVLSVIDLTKDCDQMVRSFRRSV